MQRAILILGAVAIPLAGLFVAFEPLWETNDDVAMSMVAHGYGLAAYGSPHLIFSNVVWGHLVRAIPSIGGVSGYGVATVACFVVIGWSTLYFLNRLGAPFVVAWLAVGLLLLRPALFPQFTINAGLLAVAAILSWRAYARDGDVGNLIVACALAFTGYLIRERELMLVLFVGMPLMPWRVLRHQGRMPITVVLLSAACVTAFAVDRWSYQARMDSVLGTERTAQAIHGLRGERAPAATTGDHGPLRLQRKRCSPDRKLVLRRSCDRGAGDIECDPRRARACSAAEGSIRSGLTAIEALAAPELLPLLCPRLCS